MSRFFLGAAVALGLLAAPALADGNFVRLGNINGAATEIQHQSWIEAGQWGVESKKGLWFFSAPTSTFWFEKRSDGSSGQLQQALQQKTFFDRALFDVSIRGTILRTTFHGVRVIGVEARGRTEKITLQYKYQTDQQITFTASR